MRGPGPGTHTCPCTPCRPQRGCRRGPVTQAHRPPKESTEDVPRHLAGLLLGSDARGSAGQVALAGPRSSWVTPPRFTPSADRTPHVHTKGRTGLRALGRPAAAGLRCSGCGSQGPEGALSPSRPRRRHLQSGVAVQQRLGAPAGRPRRLWPGQAGLRGSLACTLAAVPR